jgi:hypothetical protein
MEERRKEKRLEEENEIAVTIVNDEKNPVKEKRFNNLSMDISVSGAKIKSNILLPVDTVIAIKMKLRNVGKMIATIGKVKWNAGTTNDMFYKAGEEFVDTPGELILELEEYIAQEWIMI